MHLNDPSSFAVLCQVSHLLGHLLGSRYYRISIRHELVGLLVKAPSCSLYNTHLSCPSIVAMQLALTVIELNDGVASCGTAMVTGLSEEF